MRPAHDHAAILHVSQMGCSDIRGVERNQGSGAEEAPNGRRTSSPSARRTGARQAWSLDYTLIGPIPVVLVPPTGPAAAMRYDRSLRRRRASGVDDRQLWIHRKSQMRSESSRRRSHSQRHSLTPASRWLRSAMAPGWWLKPAPRGRRTTSWPSLKTDLRNAGADWVDEEVVVDRGLVTSRSPKDIPAFNREMIRLFSSVRGKAQHSGMTPFGKRQ